VQGIPIAERPIRYEVTDTYGRALLIGFLNTLRVAVIGVVLASLIGVLVGVMRLSSNWLVRGIATVYVELLRNIPLAVQIVFWYAAILLPFPPRISNPVALPGGALLSNIGLAFPSAEPGTDESIVYNLALGVLSGSMGSRLFTEVREKRGLVYSVSAFSRGLRGFGYTIGYAGTTPERADETLSVFLAELERLTEGVSADEFDRARTGILSSLVMQGESSGATAARLASDMYMLGRARTLDEIRSRIEAVDLATLNDYLAANPLPTPMVVTLGPGALELA